jgi:hypothetical protein
MNSDDASLCSRDVSNSTRVYSVLADGDYSISLDIKDNKVEYTPPKLDTETKITEVKVTTEKTNKTNGKEKED